MVKSKEVMIGGYKTTVLKSVDRRTMYIAVEFAKWIADDSSPFIKDKNGKWFQALDNRSWTIEELFKQFLKENGMDIQR